MNRRTTNLERARSKPPTVAPLSPQEGTSHVADASCLSVPNHHASPSFSAASAAAAAAARAREVPNGQPARNEGNGGGAASPRSDAAAPKEGDDEPYASEPPPPSLSEAPMHMDAFGSELWRRHSQPPEDAWSHEPAADEASSAAETFAQLAMSQLQHGIEAAEEAEHAAEEAVEVTDAAMGLHHHHLHAMAAAEQALKAVPAGPAAPEKQVAPHEESKGAAAAAAAALEAKAQEAATRAAEAAAVTAKAEAALAAIYASQDAGAGTPGDGAALAGEGAAVELGQRVPVSFELRRHVSYGERVVLVGSGPALGSWKLRSAVELCWSLGDVWRTPAPLLLPVDATLVYKYVVLHGSGDDAPTSWQRGANNVLMLSAEDAPALHVVDSWTADPLESRAVSGIGASQRSTGPAERLAAVSEARMAELRRARERADAAEAALERERLASRALRAEASVAAGLRARLRGLLEAEQQRTALLQREVAAFHAALRGFRAKLTKRISMTDATEAR